LIVEVEGRGDSQGQLVADKIRFRESDMRAALTTDTRVGPVEENQQKIAGKLMSFTQWRRKQDKK
jgi:hypothetical protein